VDGAKDSEELSRSRPAKSFVRSLLGRMGMGQIKNG
jgi:hypothetical protein